MLPLLCPYYTCGYCKSWEIKSPAQIHIASKLTTWIKTRAVWLQGHDMKWSNTLRKTNMWKIKMLQKPHLMNKICSVLKKQHEVRKISAVFVHGAGCCWPPNLIWKPGCCQPPGLSAGTLSTELSSFSYILMYDWISLLSTLNYHNIVNWLHSNTK